MKSATSWGIAVIWMVRARIPPTAAPTITAAATVVQSRIWLSSSVATIAMSIASDARALPERAVAGEESCLIPETNRIAEIR